MKTLFHVTPISNLDSIMREGLLPQIGERASQLEGEKMGVFMFSTYDDCEYALENWLGEEFEDLEEELLTLKIDLPQNHSLIQDVEWEFISRIEIDPKHISVFKIEG